MILVTGATGFLGHHLAPMLVQAGYQVRALVRPSSDTGFLKQLGVELAVADDICDAAAVTQACEGCRSVIHAAGLFRFWGDDADFHRVNVQGTETVLHAAVAAVVKRFIYISTVAVVGRIPDGQWIDEDAPCRPLGPYQHSKLQAERLALSYHQEHSLPVIVLRPGAYYGPWGRYGFNRLFFEEPLHGWRIKVDGGRHITFPVYVQDVAQAILLALDRGRPGEVYNICDDPISHNDANAIISDLAGIGRWRVNVPAWAMLLLARIWTALSRYTHHEPFYPINLAPYVFQDWRVCSRRAREVLGFQPTPFAKGAQMTLKWYREQEILKRRKAPEVTIP